MDLPTDVVLRTTDYLGSMLADMHAQASDWLDAIPLDPNSWPLVHDAYLDAYDEFYAAPFIAAHGWYRQATAGLRNALEVMTHAARFAVRGDQAGYQAWRAGTTEPLKFGNSSDLIGQAASIAAVEMTLGGPSVFGVNPAGVIRSLYADVCRYAHGAPGHTNADIWGSNGPVFVPRAFTQFWLDYCDTFIACCVVLKLAYPAMDKPDVLDSVAGNAGPSWLGIAPAAVSAYFA